jgi:CysZ protein
MNARRPLGFFAGVRAMLGGIGFIMTRPSVWGWAMVPVLAATLLFGGLGALSIWGANELSASLLPPSDTWAAVGTWVVRILLWLVGLVIAFVVAISLAQPISGFALEAIARRQELALGGRTWPDQPLVRSALRSLRVSLAALAIGLPVLGLLAVVTLLFPPAGIVTIPLKFVVTGLLAAYDLLDYPMSLRGRGVRARLLFMKEESGAVLGFAVTVGALLLIPGAGLLLLPFGVAGATRLARSAERTSANQEAAVRPS